MSLLLGCALCLSTLCSVRAGTLTYNNVKGLVPDCADPYVLCHDGKYYLYGTGGADGIKVYVSENMVEWSPAMGATGGYALHKDHVFGTQWFWAPEVYYIDGRFCMFYSANERISMAESDSPLGPFRQDKEFCYHDAGEIDTHLFIDDDGRKYLYYVRFTNGNEIWVAELNDDMRSVKEETLTHCLGANDAAAQPWEQVQARVTEGPFVLKHNGTYYLTYSANHYESKQYAVGYATSDSPMGPWRRYANNPVLIGNDQLTGTGHHSFLTTPSGCNLIVYHAHNTPNSVQPRKTCMDTYEFVPSETPGEPDVLEVNGPTTTDQEFCPGQSGGETSLPASETAPARVWTAADGLTVATADGRDCQLLVTAADGTVVCRQHVAGTQSLTLPQSVYVVEINDGVQTVYCGKALVP